MSMSWYRITHLMLKIVVYVWTIGNKFDCYMIPTIDVGRHYCAQVLKINTVWLMVNVLFLARWIEMLKHLNTIQLGDGVWKETRKGWKT